jgi:hypothetical protein
LIPTGEDYVSPSCPDASLSLGPLANAKARLRLPLAGNGKVAQTTIGGTPINGIPPVSVGSTTSPTQTTTRASGRWGDPGANDPSSAGSQPAIPRPQIEAGSSQDMFVVYRGKKDDPSSSPLEAPAVWRYSGKDALASPSVLAVEAFHKLVVESEKQQAAHP